MCCGKINPKDIGEAEWWELIHLPRHNATVRFSSESEAIGFLAAGVDRLTQPRDLELYQRLNWQREQAEG